MSELAHRMVGAMFAGVALAAALYLTLVLVLALAS